MHAKASTAALMGLAGASLVAAMPTRASDVENSSFYSTPVPTPSMGTYSYSKFSTSKKSMSTPMSMTTPMTSGYISTATYSYKSKSKGSGSQHSSLEDLTVTYSELPFPTEVKADGDKFQFPLSNDFPNPDDGELDDINESAGGTLPNGPPGTPPSSDAVTSFQLIAFNELFEVAFFTSLLQNITEGVDGYSVDDATKLNIDLDDLVQIIASVQAQEELHTLNANGALKLAGVDQIQPCEYVFPVDNLADAIALAATFTDVVLGTLQDVENDFGLSGDIQFLRGVASVIGQEGEQNGFFRLFQGKRPSAEPFLTASTREFAFSALNQNFVVPGSCPNIEQIDLPIFGALTLVSQPKDKDSTVTFQVDLSGGDNRSGSNSTTTSSSSNKISSTDMGDLSLVLINGQNVPIVEQPKNVKQMGDGVVQFDADFLFQTDLLFGLTIAVLTDTKDGLTDVDKVADATVFGPALIEVD